MIPGTELAVPGKSVRITGKCVYNCLPLFPSGDWVPLDEYYYGKKEGDPAYVEEKAEYRFKVGS